MWKKGLRGILSITLYYWDGWYSKLGEKNKWRGHLKPDQNHKGLSKVMVFWTKMVHIITYILMFWKKANSHTRSDAWPDNWSSLWSLGLVTVSKWPHLEQMYLSEQSNFNVSGLISEAIDNAACQRLRMGGHNGQKWKLIAVDCWCMSKHIWVYRRPWLDCREHASCSTPLSSISIHHG